VCVCVWEREREGERGRKGEKQRERRRKREGEIDRERERASEREREREREAVRMCGTHKVRETGSRLNAYELMLEHVHVVKPPKHHKRNAARAGNSRPSFCCIIAHTNYETHLH
jgi:hypothetical protein